MTVTIVHDHGRMLLRVSCDGCHRVAATDVLTPTELCRLISWDCDLGRAYCLECQWRRHRVPAVAYRLTRRR